MTSVRRSGLGVQELLICLRLKQSYGCACKEAEIHDKLTRIRDLGLIGSRDVDSSARKHLLVRDVHP